MRSCFGPLPPASTGNSYNASPSQENIGTSSIQPSPIVNLTEEFSRTVLTDSYGEIRTIFNREISFDQNVDIEQIEFPEEHQILEQFLQPSRDSVQEILALLESNSRTRLIETYFEHSESTSRLCLQLYQSVHRARHFYNPVYNLLDVLPLEFGSYSLSHSQCSLAFNVFLKFHGLENPFLSSESSKFDEICQCFTLFRQQLSHRIEKSRSSSYFSRGCSKRSTFCIIAAGIGIAITAAAIATHGFFALASLPMCPVLLPSYTTKKEMAHLAQLDAASKGCLFLHTELDTIARLVAQINSVVDNDKQLIRQSVDRGVDRYFIQEVLKQLWRNRSRFVQQLDTLENHLYLCFASVNRVRNHVLQEIYVHQIVSKV